MFSVTTKEHVTDSRIRTLNHWFIVKDQDGLLRLSGTIERDSEMIPKNVLARFTTTSPLVDKEVSLSGQITVITESGSRYTLLEAISEEELIKLEEI